MPEESYATESVGLDLFWLPLGAGGHSVRWNGRIYEAVCALAERRTASDLYHSALRVSLPPEFWVVEMTPVWAVSGAGRGVVAEGAVGARWAGRSRLFRYEVHVWNGGTISDVAEAVASPERLSSDRATCRCLLDRLPSVPNLVWGRDEQNTGEMWNSNSVTSWALTSSGIDARSVRPPRGGRARGWNAGIAVAEQGGVPGAAGTAVEGSTW